jgi:serine/threonine-protein kinase RsbW
VFPSTPLAVRETLAQIVAALTACELPGEERGAIEIVLAEVLNNIVEHAYAAPDSGTIELSLRPTAIGLRCEVLDRGRPMPEGRLPLGGHPERGRREDLPEGGFGWLLIHSLCQDLVYERQASQNRLTFRFAVEVGGGIA